VLSFFIPSQHNIASKSVQTQHEIQSGKNYFKQQCSNQSIVIINYTILLYIYIYIYIYIYVL